MIDIKYSSLAAVIKQFQENCDLISINNLMIIQQKIYLLQNLIDTPFDFKFNWVKSSPYSDNLNKTIICLNAESDISISEFVGKNIRQFYLSSIRLINDLSNSKPSDISNIIWYKLIGAVFYFRLQNNNDFYATYEDMSKHIDIDFYIFISVNEIINKLKSDIQNVRDLYEHNYII